MEDWQKDIMDAIENNRWQAEDLSDVAEVRAKPNMIPPVQNYEFILDIVYFAARKLKGKRLTPEHEKLFNEYDDVLRNQGMKGFHDANVETHANVRDEDTDKRDEKYYPNDRLHDIQKSWANVLKAPFPNHMLGNRRRKGRPVLRGSGKNGLFRYNEIDSILDDEITPLIDARYEKEIKKKTNESIREAKKRLKAQNKEFSKELEDYITRKVRKVLTKQKQTNVYATAYGKYAHELSGSKGNWFSGGLSPLGYNPDDPEQMRYVMRRVSGLGRQYFTTWGQNEDEEEGDEVVKSWINILKARDYRYGRCQAGSTISFANGVMEGSGNACVRPLQSPERRKAAGSKPDGKICMYCEDDQYKHADIPKEVYTMFPKFKGASSKEQAKMLDLYVKRNPRYKQSDFEPFYD